MANLPPVSVLGPEGPPPMKKMRTDSDSGEKRSLTYHQRGVWLKGVS